MCFIYEENYFLRVCQLIILTVTLKLVKYEIKYKPYLTILTEECTENMIGTGNWSYCSICNITFTGN